MIAFSNINKRQWFGKHTEVIINHCFTLDDIIAEIMNREKDELVDKVVLQCGLDDFVRSNGKCTQVFDNIQDYIQLFREFSLMKWS